MILIFGTLLCQPGFVFGHNEDDNPVVFLRFEHHELSKDTFLKEQKLVATLRKLRNMLEDRRQLIKRFANRVHGHSTNLGSGTPEDSITAFNVLKRSALILPNFKSVLAQASDNLSSIKASVNKTIADFPTEQDYNGAVKGLVMLHETYMLDLDAANKGKLAYITSQFLYNEFLGREKLQTDDYYEMSSKATSQFLFDVGIEFLRAAFVQAEKKKPAATLMKKMKTLRKNLVHLNNQHLLKWQKMLGVNYKCFPFLVDENMNPKQTPTDLMKSIYKIDIENSYQFDFCFKQVCRAEAFTRRPEKLNLPKCGYLHHFDPYLRLGPFKVEVISRSPYISILHDLLTEEEIQWMIEYSVPRLSRVRDNHGQKILPKYLKRDKKKRQTVHKTVQCWIQDIMYDDYNQENDLFNYTINFPLMFKLSKKLELATQMNVTGKYSASDFQTTNYGLGGLCERHIDPHGYIEGAEVVGSQKSLIQSGDMIGTIMAWLGDVEAGGGTAFVHRNVERTVMPTRGSAAFWYNLDMKGFRDQRSQHGGCPVIKGSKWILNKWVFYYNQHKNFPCGLNSDAYFPPPKGYYTNISQ